MKNKLIIVSLMAILHLQGSEYNKGTLKEAVELALSNRQQKINTPIIFYGKHQLQEIQDLMDKQDTKQFIDKSMCIFLVSDINDTSGSVKNRRKRVGIGVKKEWDCSLGQYVYAKNEIVEDSEQNMDYDQLLSVITRDPQNLTMFNMFHAGIHPNTGRYANEIKNVLNQKAPVFAIISPECNGDKIEALCKEININPIIFNKPENAVMVFFKNSWKNYWQVITGFSIVGLFVFLYKINH